MKLIVTAWCPPSALFKVWDYFFSKRSFSWKDIFWGGRGGIYGGWLFYFRGTSHQILPSRDGSFINAFSSSLDTVYLKIFASHVGIFTWSQSPDHSTELWKDLYLMVIVKRVQRLCHAQFPACWLWPGILIYCFETLTPEIGVWIWKAPFVHYTCGGGDFMQNLSTSLISLVVNCSLMLWL